MMAVDGIAQRDTSGREEFWASLALRYCPGLGVTGTKILLEHFGSAFAAARDAASWRELGIGPRACGNFAKESWRTKAKEEWDAAWQSSCGLVLWKDDAYPAWLRAVDDPPLFLYYLGDARLLANVAVAVVGARECSVEGLRATVHIARGLSAAGVTVISGMARGIDRAAHLAALEGPGSSIAVLGTGVDVLYPKANLDLRALLCEKGLLVSEFAPSLSGDGRLFPIRNRIISGLSQAVLVTEAAMRSGSLNTARHALEQGRDVFAVPGPVSLASSKGCQELIRRGAKAAFCADDILRELLPFLTAHVRRAVEARDLARFAPRRDGPVEEDPFIMTLMPGLLPWESADDGDAAPRKTPDFDAGSSGSGCARRTSGKTRGSKAGQCKGQFDTPQALLQGTPTPGSQAAVNRDDISDEALAVLNLLQKEALHIDDICRALGQNAGMVSGLLTTMEMKRYVRRLPGMVYALAQA